MGHIMTRRTRLTGLEIDEVSLVDRPANQHGVVAIAKRDGEQSMGIYDAEGYEVDENDLEHGQVVYDDAGNEFLHVDPSQLTEEDVAELQDLGISDEAIAEVLDSGVDEGDDEDDDEPVGPRQLTSVGKSAQGVLGSQLAGWAGKAKQRSNFTRAGVGAVGLTGYGAGRHNGKKIGRGQAVGKSLGESVYEELSKALTTGDKDEVISKALGMVDEYRREAQEAVEISKALADERDTQAWLEHCSDYGPLPMALEEVAEIMKSAAATMPAAQVRKMDAAFRSMGEQAFAELGTSGGAGSDTYEMIEALADSHVGKSELTREQAITGLFDANPAAYDDYLSERSY